MSVVVSHSSKATNDIGVITRAPGLPLPQLVKLL